MENTVFWRQGGADVEGPDPAIRRILLVDDEQAFLEVQSEILRRLGYSVAPNHNAAAALELFAGNPLEFDLIITDEIMPGMVGSEMCRRIREVRPEIPIIIMTAGLDLSRTREKAALCGGGQVLLKPVLKKELRRAIEMAGRWTPAFMFSKNP
jgi:CheY-like chemotaxis protein